MLQYRNTPSTLDKRSPAEIVFGHQIRDFIPVKPGKYIPCPTWSSTAVNRETAMMQRHAKEVEKLSEHTKKLPALKVGDHVRLQNQTGPAPLKWDRSGTIIEVRQNDQYAVKVHGSGRPTLRNRKFLRKYVPFVTPLPPATISQHIVSQGQEKDLLVQPRDVPISPEEEMAEPLTSLHTEVLSPVLPSTTETEPMTSESHESNEAVPTPVPVGVPSIPAPLRPSIATPSRPRRKTKPPVRFGDFVMK